MPCTRRALRTDLPRPPAAAAGRGACRPTGRWRAVLVASVVTAAACSLTGCSLFVMAGKMLFGDPLRDCAFKQVTQVDLTEGKKKVLVHCAAPHHILSQYDGMDYEMVERITRHLKARDIPVIDVNDVKAWMDENGSLQHARDLATQFETDYIIQIELKQFTQHEENSEGLYRGTLSGSVTGWEVVTENGQKRVWQVYFSEFTSVYPEFSPLSRHQISSPEVFVRACVSKASLDLAQIFYDHRPSETVH